MIRTGLTRVPDALGGAVSRIPPRVRRWAYLSVLLTGLAVLLVAAALLARPATVGRLVDAEALDRRLRGTAGIAVVAGGILLATAISIWKGATATTRADAEPIRPSENAVAAGSTFDDDLEAVIETGDEDRRAAVRMRLRSAAIETVSTRSRRDDSGVREAVLTGGWTDDAVAGAFLGDERAADGTLRWRLYAWLYPDRAFRTTVERTLDAIESYDPEEGP